MDFIYRYKDGETKITIDGKEVICGEISIHQKANESDPQINITNFHDLRSLKPKKCDALSWQGEYLRVSPSIKKTENHSSWLERAKKEAVKATSEEFDKFFKEVINNMVNSDDKT